MDRAAAPDWAWPPIQDDLDAIRRIDVEAVVRRQDGGLFAPSPRRVADTRATGPLCPDAFVVVPTAAVSIRPRRLRFVLPVVAAAGIVTGVVSWRDVRVPPHAHVVVATAGEPVRSTHDTHPVVSTFPGQMASLPASETRTTKSSPGGVHRAAVARQVEPEARVLAPPGQLTIVVPTSAPIPSPLSGLVDGSAVTMAAVERRAPGLTALVASTGAPAAPTGAFVPDVAAPPVVAEAAPVSEALPLPVRSEEPSVRDVLHRYGAAYSRLDASAARAVWPAVDVRALGRAFEALRSQQVRFSDCRVTVKGDAADATCTGTATWVPRVGDPAPRVESREWRFHLTRDDRADWHIENVRSR